MTLPIAESTIENSFLSSSFSSPSPSPFTNLLDSTSFETKDHPLIIFEDGFEPCMNNNKVSMVFKDSDSNSPNMLITPIISLVLKSVCFFSIPFNANRTVLWIIFLDCKLFLSSFEIPISPPLLLLKIDRNPCTYSFDSRKESLAVPHKSKIRTDPSRSAATQVSFRCRKIACLVKFSSSTSSMESCRCCNSLKCPEMEEDKEELASPSLNLLECSSTLEEIGYGFEGKLFERAWLPSIFWC